MGSSSEGEGRGRMEGWLYLFRSNRLGLQYSRKRYFVLDHRDSSLNCYRATPTASTQVVALPLPSLTFCSMFRGAKRVLEHIGNIGEFWDSYSDYTTDS